MLTLNSAQSLVRTYFTFRSVKAANSAVALIPFSSPILSKISFNCCSLLSAFSHIFFLSRGLAPRNAEEKESGLTRLPPSKISRRARGRHDMSRSTSEWRGAARRERMAS